VKGIAQPILCAFLNRDNDNMTLHMSYRRVKIQIGPYSNYI